MKQQNLQTDFFAQMRDVQSYRTLFDHITDIFFFIKDTQGRFMAANRAVVERLGFQEESELIGLLDKSIIPESVGSDFRNDDLEIIRTGNPLVNRLEVWYGELRQLDWFVTTKVPVYGSLGEIIGIMGLTRRDKSQSPQHPNRTVATAIDFITKNVNRNLTIQEVARVCNISERTLNRRIRESLGASPYEIMLRIRIQIAARSLVEGNKSLSTIALESGFCDQSSFTQHFRKRTGFTPLQFRKRYPF